MESDLGLMTEATLAAIDSVSEVFVRSRFCIASATARAHAYVRVQGLLVVSVVSYLCMSVCNPSM
jgi:hypothetical protein